MIPLAGTSGPSSVLFHGSHIWTIPVEEEEEEEEVEDEDEELLLDDDAAEPLAAALSAAVLASFLAMSIAKLSSTGVDEVAAGIPPFCVAIRSPLCTTSSSQAWAAGAVVMPNSDATAENVALLDDALDVDAVVEDEVPVVVPLEV